MGHPKSEKSSQGAHDEHSHIFSPDKPPEELHFAYPALTSWAAQLVKAELIRTAETMVSEQGGLHTFSSGANDISDQKFGGETLDKARTALEKGQPLFWDYCIAMATSQPQKRKSRAKDAPEGTMAIPRNYRPPEIVVTYAMSSICYSRNRNAKLLPADKGLLLFASRANRYIFSHESHIGASISYNATLETLNKYAIHDGCSVREITADPCKNGIVRFDNVQKQIKPRYSRMSRDALMLIGCAGTFAEDESFEAGSLSLDDKKKALGKGLRAELTFEKLWAKVDWTFIDNTLPLLWIEVLLDYSKDVPEFDEYYTKLCQVFMETGTKRHVTPHKTRIFPLKSNGYNETTMTGLLSAIKDFFAQLGQTPDSFSPRLTLFGGDGLSYERMVQLKNYLQFQENEFERMEILEPFLEIWHTVWTNLSRIYEAHWVGLTSSDPSSIGFGANTLKRRAPGNVKKVDYYVYMDLLDSQVDARVLTRYLEVRIAKDLFSDLGKWSKEGELPSFEVLYEKAKTLHKKFSMPSAFRSATVCGEGYKEGSPWKAPKQSKTSAAFEKPGTSKKTGKEKKKQPEVEVKVLGDESLARSTRLIYDGMLSKLINRAIRHGDVGCVWECIKLIMLFSFAGSSHTKYTAYLLEMICNFELEADPKLQTVFFDNWLICPNGRTFEAGDLFQEQLQAELYEHVQNDQGFDDPHIRNRISPNVYRFKQVKKEKHASLGLALRSGNHIPPSRMADIRKLMTRYALEELHLFRKGRSYGEADVMRVDDLGRGAVSLQSGRLEKWSRDTCRSRKLDEGVAETLISLESQAFVSLPEGLNPDDQLQKDGFAFNPDAAEVHSDDEDEPLADQSDSNDENDK
ncbi:hypothetical protein F5890DRAFT_1421840 [Lentinula detonsa]|uniref:DUF6589 domain-containing protein n=1 Tax=Lentinula detonsa TaxID=2804962 RepID=A0AA38UM58_9AGAR|nr:hypothetical protein F5890DRAFT_1421840 [Lentinula detonsa]